MIQKLTTDIDKDKVDRDKEKKNEKKSMMSFRSETHRMTVMLSYKYIVYNSAVRFSEGYLPHNTIISDHNQRPASPKMTTISPPQIPR